MKAKNYVALLISIFLFLPGLSISFVFNPDNGHYYEIFYADSVIDWHQAKDSAENMGGHLAVVTSQAEQDIVYSLFSENDTAWAGGTDYVVDGNWIWISGESFGYNNWDADEPDGSNNLDYIQIHQEAGGKWKARTGGCRGYIVEWFCCNDSLTGNVDCDENGVINLFDIVRLLDFLYISQEPLCCFDQANVDGDPDVVIELNDILKLIDYLYLSHQPTAGCLPGEPNYAGDSVFLKDQTDKYWDITHAVNFYGMDSADFNFGLGPNAIPPVLYPQFYEPGDADYPAPTEIFRVIGLEMGDDVRAYPTQYLFGREVVDEFIDSAHVAVAF